MNMVYSMLIWALVTSMIICLPVFLISKTRFTTLFVRFGALYIVIVMPGVTLFTIWVWAKMGWLFFK